MLKILDATLAPPPPKAAQYQRQKTELRKERIPQYWL